MALSRQRMATARRVQSQRRIWLCVHDNESSNRPKIYREEVFLESENTADNKDSEASEENAG